MSRRFRTRRVRALLGARLGRHGVRRSSVLVFTCAALVALTALASTPAALANPSAGVQWRLQPALAPPPPPGVSAPANLPVALGPVGDIEFWAPNRGLLITAGSLEGTPVPMGVYAYDGESWHQLSTVCGGTHGRIAWAGPDEFWTIADQRAGQIISGGGGALLQDVSLCHFLNGEVVGSYALPLNQPNSYLPMDAAACISAADCWFGGELGQYPNSGSFHLHWDGQNVTVVYDAGARDDHAASSMAGYRETLYEGVQLQRTDEYGGQSVAEAPIVHTINAQSSAVFGDVPLKGVPKCSGICSSLPEYGNVDPTELAGFQLSSDAPLAGAQPAITQLWAAAGRSNETFTGSKEVHPLLLRCGNDDTFAAGAPVSDCGSDAWLQAPAELLAAGVRVSGLAAEPGGDSAWVSLQPEGEDEAAHVDRVTLSEHGGERSAKVDDEDILGLGGLLKEDGNRGKAGPIACPAANDCWLATEQGWLYHLSDEADENLPRDSDPNFAGVITYRPPDAGIPQLIADVPPVDDSLANQQPPPPPPPPPVETTPTTTRALVLHLHTRVVHRYTLELSFTLTAAAHVQLLASRHGHLVAHTNRRTLKAGSVKLLLRLDPKRWPTKLDLRATPLHPLPQIPVTGAPSGGNAVPAPTSSNSVST